MKLAAASATRGADPRGVGKLTFIRPMCTTHIRATYQLGGRNGISVMMLLVRVNAGVGGESVVRRRGTGLLPFLGKISTVVSKRSRRIILDGIGSMPVVRTKMGNARVNGLSFEMIGRRNNGHVSCVKNSAVQARKPSGTRVSSLISGMLTMCKLSRGLVLTGSTLVRSHAVGG